MDAFVTWFVGLFSNWGVVWKNFDYLLFGAYPQGPLGGLAMSIIMAVNGIFGASTAIMKPFSTDTLAIRVTSIEIDASGAPKQKWTMDNGRTIPATDVTTVAPTMRTPNTAVLRAETVYEYSTPFQRMLPGKFTFRHKMDLAPRAGVPIALNP